MPSEEDIAWVDVTVLCLVAVEKLQCVADVLEKQGQCRVVPYQNEISGAVAAEKSLERLAAKRHQQTQDSFWAGRVSPGPKYDMWVRVD